MKWILFGFQLLSSYKTLKQSRLLMDRAKDAAEKSKKMAFFSFTMLLFLIYFIAGSIMIAVNLGAQADSGNGIYFSGTLWAATGLIGFGLLLLSIGAIVLKFPTEEDAEQERRRNEPQDLVGSLEKLALTFVNQMVKNLVEKVEKPAPRSNTAAPETQAQRQQNS